MTKRLSREHIHYNQIVLVLIPQVICFVELLEASRTMWWFSAHEVITVAKKKQEGHKLLGENTDGVDQSGYPFKPDQVQFNPLAEDVLF